MSNLFTLPKEVILSNSGALIPGAQAYFYAAGTATPQSVYSDSDLSTAHSHPVVADGDGRFPAIYLDESLNYKVQLTDADDVEIYTEDDFTVPALSVADVVAALYPQTAAEIAAGVTPTATEYEPGDVRRYGAVGDGVTDDTAAIQAAIDVYLQAVADGASHILTVTGNPNIEHGRTLELKPAGIYRVTSSLFLGYNTGGTADYTKGVKNIEFATGFTIVSEATGDIALDCSGAYNMRINNLTLVGDDTNTPAVGIFFARTGTEAINPSAGVHRFHNARVYGHFSVATIYNYSSEINTFLNCWFTNSDTGSAATYYITSMNSRQKIISNNSTIDTSYQSCYGDNFVNCDFRFDQEAVTELTDNFDFGDVNAGTDRITLTGHGFTSGQAVLYTEGTSAVTGLTDDASYFIKSIDGNTVELYSDRLLTSIVNITAAGSGTGHALKRNWSACIVIEGASYGPKFLGCYFDLLQGATTSPPVVLFTNPPGASASQQRTQCPSFRSCVIENDMEAFIYNDGDVREMVIDDCSYGADVVTADIVNAGFMAVSQIQGYRGTSSVEKTTYSNTGTLRNLEYYRTFDPGNIADGLNAGVNVTALDAEIGDFVVASLSIDPQDLVISAQVNADDVVRVTYSNTTGSPVDLGSHTLRVKVFKFSDF